jgi:8-oxo-dGTP pyrophosphatase MutT (NUDIX family)
VSEHRERLRRARNEEGAQASNKYSGRTDVHCSLHADATAVLTAYQPNSTDQVRLRADYLAHLAAHPDALLRSCSPAHLTASAAVLDARAERVLLVLHRKVGLWLQPGGHCEPSDISLAKAALREATEETGIDGLRFAGGPVHLDRHRAPCGVEHHLDVMFALVAPDGAMPTVSVESADVRWFDVTELPDPTDDAVRAVVRAAGDQVRREPAPQPARP